MRARLGRSLGILANNAGVACKQAGRLRAAGWSYRVAMATNPSDPRLVAALLHNRAGLEHARGRAARGEPLARRGLALREAIDGPDHADYAADLGALAAIVDAVGRFDEAEAMYGEALTHPAVRPEDAAVARRNLARLRARRGQVPAARMAAMGGADRNRSRRSSASPLAHASTASTAVRAAAVAASSSPVRSDA
jgi:hypothetical protein